MIDTFITFILSNFTLTFFVVGLLFSAFAIGGAPKPISQALVVEKLLSWFVFWTIGVLYFYNFIFHVFFGEMAAAFIGALCALGATRLTSSDPQAQEALQPTVAAPASPPTTVVAPSTLATPAPVAPATAVVRLSVASAALRVRTPE